MWNCPNCGQPLVRKVYLRMKRGHSSYELESLMRFLGRTYCGVYCRNSDLNRKYAPIRAQARIQSTEERSKRSESMRKRWEEGTMLAQAIVRKRRFTPDWSGLTEEQIRAIIVDPRRYRMIGDSYQISASVVGYIKRGKLYPKIANRPVPVISRGGRRNDDVMLPIKLSDNDIRAIIVDPASYADIARRYGVSKSWVGILKKRPAP